jgi:hypothetical protein
MMARSRGTCLHAFARRDFVRDHADLPGLEQSVVANDSLLREAAASRQPRPSQAPRRAPVDAVHA